MISFPRIQKSLRNGGSTSITSSAVKSSMPSRLACAIAYLVTFLLYAHLIFQYPQTDRRPCHPAFLLSCGFATVPFSILKRIDAPATELVVLRRYIATNFQYP